MSLGGTLLLRRQRQILHIAEKAKRMLVLKSAKSCVVGFSIHYLPESNAETPDGLHLVARCLISTDPVAVFHADRPLVLNSALECSAKLVCGRSHAGRANDFAVEV